MRIQKIIIALFLNLLVNICQGTTLPDTIYWCSERKLSWTDFTWKANEETGAASSSHVTVRELGGGGKIKFEVLVFFNKKKSWTNDSSVALLEHEQIHFDIAELTARRIRKFLSDKNVTENNIDTIVETVHTMLAFQKQINVKYDDETDHGTIDKKQKEWQEFIKKSLLELKEYEVDCKGFKLKDQDK